MSKSKSTGPKNKAQQDQTAETVPKSEGEETLENRTSTDPDPVTKDPITDAPYNSQKESDDGDDTNSGEEPLDDGDGANSDEKSSDDEHTDSDSGSDGEPPDDEHTDSDSGSDGEPPSDSPFFGVSSYNPEKHLQDTRSALAKALIWLISFTLGGALWFIGLGVLEGDALTQAIFPSLVALAGTALGFYFGSQSARKPNDSR